MNFLSVLAFSISPRSKRVVKRSAVNILIVPPNPDTLINLYRFPYALAVAFTKLMLDSGCLMLDNYPANRCGLITIEYPVEDPGRIFTGETSIEDQPMN